MVLQISRIFYLLILISVVSVLLILFWGHASKPMRNGPRGEDCHPEFWREKETPTPTVFDATQKAKNDDSMTEVAKLKTKMRPSTHTVVEESILPVLSNESVNKLPQWGFGDEYNEDTPPRNTTCVRSLHNSEDESFKKAFLPNIRPFLHKDSINVSEWNRLSHFNKPFGFMGYKYDDVMTSVKLIPRPAEPRLLPKPGREECVRCAVVGAAGILNGSKMGKEIDGHDYVFRMNGAVIKGYEDDVGSRTSVYLHTAHSITRSLRTLKKYGYTSVPVDQGIKYVLMPEGLRDFYWIRGLLKGERVSAGQDHNEQPRMFYGGQYSENRFCVLHQDFLRYVRNRFLKSDKLDSSDWAMFRPTNGAFALFLALHTCDIVSAYGFMTDDYNKYSNYYFETNKTDVVFFLNHDYILEKNMWTKLHNSKIIRLYQRTDSVSTEQHQ